MNIILVVICIICLGYSVYKLYMYYNWDDLIEGLDNFVGRQAINSEYYVDHLFDQVYYYPNDAKDGTTGWMRCKSECSGSCLELGVSGNSYCFSY